MSEAQKNCLLFYPEYGGAKIPFFEPLQLAVPIVIYPLKPITVFFGPNNSGKTSILKGIYKKYAK